jgi:hypothetical protein
VICNTVKNTVTVISAAPWAGGGRCVGGVDQLQIGGGYTERRRGEDRADEDEQRDGGR